MDDKRYFLANGKKKTVIVPKNFVREDKSLYLD